MKVSITGHTSGIGKHLYESLDNTIGFSRSNGFDIENVDHGLGLTNIHYRISRSGIQGDFVSEIGKGTRVNLSIN